MRVVVQRSREAWVSVNDEVVGKISSGLMILVGFKVDDTIDLIPKMVKKVLNLRIFDDENGVMNKSVLDVQKEILSISQFTLYADSRKGNRPSYINAMKGEEAVKLYNEFNGQLSKEIHVETGKFGEDMQITFTADGPITITLDVE